MDSNQKLRIKVGQHEFEAEGPAEVVQAQFEAFARLIAQIPAVSSAAGTPPAVPGEDNGAPIQKRDFAAVDDDLQMIMRVDARIVSFTVPPASAQDAILLLLYGQKILRQNDSVTGYEVINGLEATGGLSVNRPDRLLTQAATAGDVIALGEGRGKRYRLTNTGLSKARQLASDLISKVA